MISKTALMQLGPLLLELRSRPLARSLLLGHTSTTLGKLGLLASLIRGATMLAGDLLTPLPKLTLAGANPRTFTRPRHKQRKRHQYDQHDNDHDDQCGRHPSPPLNGPRYRATGVPRHPASHPPTTHDDLIRPAGIQ
jgi:hypothetical protein